MSSSLQWLLDNVRFALHILSYSDYIFTLFADMVEQGIELAQKPHIVISTPGRLADHIDSGTNFSLKKIKYLVQSILYM